MASSLEKFPPEIFEGVAQHLNLPDTRRLRLASRRICTLATQGTFKGHFVNRNVRITETDLTSLVESTRPGQLGCLIENLTLTGLAIDTSLLQTISEEKARWTIESTGPISSSTQHTLTPEELTKVSDDLRSLKWRKDNYMMLKVDGVFPSLLTKALGNIVANGKLGRLRSLTLDVAVLREDDVTEESPLVGGAWKVIWKTASDCWDIAITSLADSHLNIDELHAFTSTPRCSLGSDQLTAVTPRAIDLAHSLRNLMSLSLSLSDRLLHDSQLESKTQTAELQALLTHPDNFTGLGSLLRLAPQLKSLHLHYYQTHQCRWREDREDLPRSESLIFDSLAPVVSLPYLTTLTLRGVFTTGNALLTLLRSAPIRDFSMEEVRLRGDTFSSVFDYCTSSEAGMQRLFFDDLWEEGRLVFFEGEGNLKFRYSSYFNGGQTLERRGPEVGRLIRGVFPGGRARGSPQAYVWRERRKREYGPP